MASLDIWFPVCLLRAIASVSVLHPTSFGLRLCVFFAGNSLFLLAVLVVLTLAQYTLITVILAVLAEKI